MWGWGEWGGGAGRAGREGKAKQRKAMQSKARQRQSKIECTARQRDKARQGEAKQRARHNEARQAQIYPVIGGSGSHLLEEGGIKRWDILSRKTFRPCPIQMAFSTQSKTH